MHTAPSGKPGELHVSHRTPTSAQLSWTPVPKDQQNGIITGYTVQVAGPDFIQDISIADATTTSAEVSGLRPNTSYYFSVSAMTVAGTGPPTRSFSITPRGGKAYELPIYLHDIVL
jgi:deleted in colorectal carcinoma protein